MAVRKQKKITIKFFLNKLIEPEMLFVDNGYKAHFPLYIQVTYDRKNTQLKSKYGWYYTDMKEVDVDSKAFEEKTLKKVIRYETSKSENEYELKGLKQKYEIYSQLILVASEEYLMPHLKKAILKTEDEFSRVLNCDSAYVDVKLIYRAAKMLIKDFDHKIDGELLREINRHLHYSELFDLKSKRLDDFATIIDWVDDGTYPAELKKALEKKYKRKPEIISEVMTYVDDLVNEYLKKIS